MQVWQGRSDEADAGAAVAGATDGWDLRSARPDLLIAFMSTKQDPAAVAARLAERFPGTVIVGCTTAGEQLGAAHSTGRLILTALRSPTLRFSAVVARDLPSVDREGARRLGDDLLGQLGIAREDLDPKRHFCLFISDGLAHKEELVSSLMADALENIPIIGGSAGDDLAFKETHVILGGEALPSAMVLVLAESTVPFDLVKHQNYRTTERTLVITRSDLKARRVLEIDGYLAIEGYARALGLDVTAVTPEVAADHPLTFTYEDQVYLRSAAKLEDDGTMTFFCALEEGIVLSIGAREDMETALTRDIAAALTRSVKPDLFIGFNCILRALAAKKLGCTTGIGCVLEKAFEHAIAFDTYGEQYNGLHMNQTLVGIALYGA